MKNKLIICAVLFALIAIVVIAIAVNGSNGKNSNITDDPRSDAMGRLLKISGGREAGYSVYVDGKTTNYSNNNTVIILELVHKKMGSMGKYAYEYSSNEDGTYTYEYNYPYN